MQTYIDSLVKISTSIGLIFSIFAIIKSFFLMNSYRNSLGKRIRDQDIVRINECKTSKSDFRYSAKEL